MFNIIFYPHRELVQMEYIHTVAAIEHTLPEPYSPDNILTYIPESIQLRFFWFIDLVDKLWFPVQVSSYVYTKIMTYFPQNIMPRMQNKLQTIHQEQKGKHIPMPWPQSLK